MKTIQDIKDFWKKHGIIDCTSYRNLLGDEKRRDAFIQEGVEFFDSSSLPALFTASESSI